MITDDTPIADDIGSSAFRILQESLTNVLRHAKATSVAIRLEQTPSLLTLDVTDDGIGAPRACLTGTRSLGVVGMRERALACGGEFTITPVDGHGTRVSLRVPLARAGQ
ncbi:MAG TPA: ATP-binding protein [Gemmatimonadaceae bacterium]|nr:ATP-binding protein [Gemmatimonadaceae bacterium]